MFSPTIVPETSQAQSESVRSSAQQINVERTPLQSLGSQRIPGDKISFRGERNGPPWPDRRDFQKSVWGKRNGQTRHDLGEDKQQFGVYS